MWRRPVTNLLLHIVLPIAGAYALAYWAALGIEPLLDRPRVAPPPGEDPAP